VSGSSLAVATTVTVTVVDASTGTGVDAVLEFRQNGSVSKKVVCERVRE
jgi:hypothetical protein